MLEIYMYGETFGISVRRLFELLKLAKPTASRAATTDVSSYCANPVTESPRPSVVPAPTAIAILSSTIFFTPAEPT